jgi:hypothetical protein
MMKNKGLQNAAADTRDLDVSSWQAGNILLAGFLLYMEKVRGYQLEADNCIYR